jgi:pimeloyl-ACP methyl ester carboxylesterase
MTSTMQVPQGMQSGMAARQLEVEGTPTRYIDHGAGDPIVLIHDGAFSDVVCSNLFAWEHNVADLSREFRVVAFDTLGQGRTGAPKEQSAYTYDSMIRHAKGFIDAVGLERIHVVGHDHGAMVALRLAFGAPEKIASCTLINCGAVAPSGDGLPNYTISGRMAPIYGREDQQWVLDRQSYTPHHIMSGQYLDEAVAIGESGEFRTVRGLIQQSQTFEKYLRPSLAKLKSDTFAKIRELGSPVPTLVLWGQQNPMSPLKAGMILFDLIAARQRVTQLRVINHAGYMPFREQATVFNAMIRGFIRGLTPSH